MDQMSIILSLDLIVLAWEFRQSVFSIYRKPEQIKTGNDILLCCPCKPSSNDSSTFQKLICNILDKTRFSFTSYKLNSPSSITGPRHQEDESSNQPFKSSPFSAFFAIAIPNTNPFFVSLWPSFSANTSKPLLSPSQTTSQSPLQHVPRPSYLSSLVTANCFFICAAVTAFNHSQIQHPRNKPRFLPSLPQHISLRRQFTAYLIHHIGSVFEVIMLVEW